MTEFFKRPACKRWIPFLLVLLAGWSVELGKMSIAWANGLDDKTHWADVVWKQKWTYFWTIAVGLGQVFLQLKSSAWTNATKSDVAPAGGP